MILIVEDDNILQMTVMRQLAKLGYTGIGASNGKEALEKFKEQNFCLVLMDIHMTVMDGLKSAKAIREYEIEEHRANAIPIIAMTANPDRNQCIEAGMNDFLFKPILLEQLKKMLDKWVPLNPSPNMS